MRFFDRNLMNVPDVFSSKKMEEQEGRVRAFLLQSEEKGQTRRVPSSEWMVRDQTFREQLSTCFNQSCSYCSRPAEPSWASENIGVASRHRPSSLAQDEDGKTDFLAYVWLTYAWENSLWVCAQCARRKGNLFYIEGERGHPSQPISELREQERELFLDPTWHSPSEHLGFTLDGQAYWKTRQGQATLEVLGLNDPDLVEERRNDVLTVLSYLDARLTEESAGLELLKTNALSLDDDLLIVGSHKAPSEDTNPFSLRKKELPFNFEISHSAAVTSALLELMRRGGRNVSDIDILLKTLFAFDVSRRQDFLFQARDEANKRPEDPETSFEGFAPRRPEMAAEAKLEPDPTPRGPEGSAYGRAFQNVLLHRVAIENFKALKEINFTLPEGVEGKEDAPCMLLLGENATGKSSVLEAMILALLGTEQATRLSELVEDEDLTPADLIHRPDPANWDEAAPGMNIRLDFLDHKQHVELFAARGDLIFSGTPDCAKVILAYGPRRFFNSKYTERDLEPALRVKSMFDPMDVIASPIHWLAELEPEAFDTVARALRILLMLEDEEDEFERDDSDLSRGQIFITRFGQRTALKDLSVGYKSVLAMACDIIRELLEYYDNLERAQAVVFIDEIETHLHPRWKMQIMELLRRAFPQVQFIVTTHDPLCLRGMHNGEVFVLQRNVDDAQVETVADLPSIHGMRAEQILTSEFFGLGSTDPKTDAKLERYNRLAARIEDLSDDERQEMKELNEALSDNMVIGSTFLEQVAAEGAKQAVQETAIDGLSANEADREELKQRFSKLYRDPFAR